MLLAHLADRVYGRPLLLAPEKVEVILAVLADRIGLEDVGPLRPELSRFAGTQTDRQPYRVTKEGIALVPVIGSLVNRGAYIGAQSGLTSYEGLTEQLTKAAKDTAVRGILLDIDSPGGEAGGAFELPALIREIRKAKPVHAMINAMALSGGYLIAAACDRISMVSTGLAGSIGVVMIHMDRSGELEKAGRRATIIHAGQRKADGHSLGPLPREVRARIQAEVETIRDMFVESVVAGRPGLKPEAVKATEAGIYMGEEAIAVGLADEIASFDRVVEQMSKTLSRHVQPPAGFNTKLEATMSQEHPAPASAGPDNKAALDAAQNAGMTAGLAKGRTEERARISTILGSEEAKGRSDLACHMAFETDMSPEAAKGLLAKAPKTDSAKPSAEAQAPKNANALAMYDAVKASGGNPRVAHAEEVPSGYVSTLADRMRARVNPATAHKGVK